MARPKGSGRIYRRGRVWWIRYFALGGHRYETSKSENRADAERLLKQRLGEIASGRFQSAGGATVGTLLDLVIRDYRLTRKRSLADLEYRVNSTIRELIGKLKAAKFGINEIDRYVQVRSRTGAADGTINRELAIIRRGFTLGKRQNPPIVTQMPYFPKIGEETV